MLSDITRFVNWVRRRNPAARTHKDYRYDLTRFAALMGDRELGTLTYRDIDHFVNQQLARGLKASTINRRLHALVSLYTWLSVEDAGLHCPVLPHRHLLREPQALPRPVAREDLVKFFAAVDSVRDLAIFLLMLRCGLRIGETAAMRMQDLFLTEERPRILVRGKGSVERAAYLSGQAEAALLAWLSERPEVLSDFVFLSYLGDGLSTTAIHKRLVRCREKAGVDLTAHQLRHSFASDLVSVDVPVTSIQVLLGHRWLESTQTYVRANNRKVSADYFRAAAELEGWS